MFSEPEKNLRRLNLREKMIVADLGAGSGYYSIVAARHVPGGKVYAIEILKDFLPTIRAKANDAGLTNIECLWGDVERPHGTNIADHVCDRVIVANILSQVSDRDGLILEIDRILKPQGEILYVDWSPNFVLGVRHEKRIISKDKARELFSKHRFFPTEEFDSGHSHYGMIFKKAHE